MSILPEHMSDGSATITTEMRDEAKAMAEQTLADAKGICQRLDLPSTAFPQVLELYANYLAGRRIIAEHKVMKEKAKRRRDKLRAKYGTANVAQVPTYGQLVQSPLGAMPFDDEDDDD